MAKEKKEKKPKIKKEKKKEKREFSGFKIPKWMLWIGIGMIVIVLEIGISYVIVTKVLQPKSTHVVETGSDSDNKTVQDDQPAQIHAPDPNRSSSQPVQQNPVGRMDDRPVQNSFAQDFSKINGIYTIPDFVINPSGSQGKHFFVVSIVYAFEDKALVDRISELEPVLQDQIISTLGRRTFEWFGDYDNREIIRSELLFLAQQLLKQTHGVSVFFTKYVLQ